MPPSFCNDFLYKLQRLLMTIFVMGLLLPISIFAWDGYDYDKDSYIEIEDEDSVVPGNHVVIYDYGDESYHEVNIISVKRDNNVFVEVFDYINNEIRVFEMSDEDKRPEKMLQIET